VGKAVAALLCAASAHRFGWIVISFDRLAKVVCLAAVALSRWDLTGRILGAGLRFFQEEAHRR
jgi:hypothetical protein